MVEVKTEYSFYRSPYQGQAIASQTDWDRTVREATAELERLKRMYTVVIPDETAEKMATCAIADVLFSNAQAAALSSASIGSISVSYREPDPRKQKRDIFEAACLYLDIYRGCC